MCIRTRAVETWPFERILRDQLDEDLRPMLAQGVVALRKHAHLHAFDINLEKRDRKGGNEGASSAIRSSRRRSLTRSPAAAAAAGPGMMWLAPMLPSCSSRKAIAPTTSVSLMPTGTTVVRSPKRSRRCCAAESDEGGVGLNRHDVVGTETTKEHGVVADVAAHVEVDPHSVLP